MRKLPSYRYHYNNSGYALRCEPPWSYDDQFNLVIKSGWKVIGWRPLADLMEYVKSNRTGQCAIMLQSPQELEVWFHGFKDQWEEVEKRRIGESNG